MNNPIGAILKKGQGERGKGNEFPAPFNLPPFPCNRFNGTRGIRFLLLSTFPLPLAPSRLEPCAFSL